MADVVSFGQWVKLRRRALLLTQEALAREVYCSTELIRKIEADARRPSPAVAARMAEKLALQADDWPLFVQVARAAVRVERLPDPLQVGGASSPAPRRATVTIPLPLTPLIGRAQELAAIRARLCQSDVRLVTLVGPPGIGKLAWRCRPLQPCTTRSVMALAL
jgi:transcriptional regulator with XRE-family HTH domain